MRIESSVYRWAEIFVSCIIHQFPNVNSFQKRKENITYSESVQFDRFKYANQPSISHLNNMGKNKQLANIFLTVPYYSEKMYKVTSADDKSL